jgi:hypothetical protein
MISEADCDPDSRTRRSGADEDVRPTFCDFSY